MSGWFGGGGSNMPSSSPVTSLRLQTSTRGRPIPLAYGKPRIAGNLIWYGDFVATPHEQSVGGKGGGTITSTTYTYTTALIMGICEGKINAIPRVWRQKDVFSGLPAASQIMHVVDEAYIVPAGLVITVANSAQFQAAVQVTADSGSDYSSRINLTSGTDYTRVGGVYTFVSGWLGRNVYISYDFTAVVSLPVDACTQLGLVSNLGGMSQTALGWMTTLHPTQALAYRNIVYVSSSSYNLAADANLKNHSFEIDTAFGFSSSIRDANPKDVIVDLLTNANYGAGFPAAKLGDSSNFSTYCIANNIFISPVYLDRKATREILANLMLITNAGALYSGGKLNFVPYGDVAATANGVTFTPNITPVYDLTDDDFLGDATSDPIRITRKPNSDAYNCVRVKFANRSNNYNDEIVEAKDQANIELYGLRAMDVNDVPELCDPVAARSIAQLMLQRQLYIRNIFEFRLGWSKALLEPMDLVTLTDAAMGMNKLPVRIMKIEEDEWGDLSVTAEEYPNNVLNAAVYNTQPPIGFAANFNVAPGNANAPVIFEPPVELAVSVDGLDLWIATGGGANYGGTQVWLSSDNTTFKQVGTINGNSRYGTLSAQLAAQTSPGISGAAVMSVTMSAGGQLLSGTLNDATVFNTLLYVGGEFMAYQTATLTGVNAYNLTTLNRGGYRSSQGIRTVGTPFVRIDQSVAKIPLTIDYVGKTVYVKLLAFNTFGGATQALADVTSTSYAVTGRFVTIAGQMGGNLCPNSSFEESITTAGLGDNFNVYNNSGAAEPTTPTRVSPGRSGAGVFQRISWSNGNTTTKGVYGSMCNTLWQPGGTYIISFYAKTSNLAFNSAMMLAWNIAPATTVALSNPFLTTSWQRYSFRITWGASVETLGTAFISIANNTSGSTATGNVELDDIMVTEGVTLLPYAPMIGEILANAVNTLQINNLAATDTIITTVSTQAIGNTGVAAAILSFNNTSLTEDIKIVVTGVGAFNNVTLSNFPAQGPIDIQTYIWIPVYVFGNSGANYESITLSGTYDQLFYNQNASGIGSLEVHFVAPRNRRTEVDFFIQGFGQFGGGAPPAGGTVDNVRLKIEIIKK